MQPTRSRKLGILFTLLFAISVAIVPSLAFAAASFVSTPAVIDGKGKPREILHYNVTLVNTTKHLVSVYAWITDVDAKVGESGASDLAGTHDKPLGSSLARWVEITRGSIDLLPGEQKDIPVTIQINMNAAPGAYHAALHLSYGPTRDDAERNQAETMDTSINIEVLDDINERLQLNTFVPSKGVFSDSNASFNYNIENIGNRGEVPRGKIRIYDKAGKEVATIDANQDGKRLEPSAKSMLSSAWASGGSFGRYKAMLDLEYGERGTLQDTVFFWVIPWKKMLGMFLTLIVLCVIAAIGMHSYSQSQRRSVFAPASRGRNMWGMRSRNGNDNEEADEPEIEEETPYRQRNNIHQLREVPVPSPVHTRPLHRQEEEGETVRLHGMPKADLSSHKVILGKREVVQPPKGHVVNLKR